MKYPLCQSTWDEEEKEIIREVVDTGMLSMGERVKQFEKEFAAYHGVKYAVMVNSGSSANLLGAAALKYTYKLRDDDEVIVPVVGWSTTYFPFHQMGFRLVFVDVNSHLGIDYDKVRESITNRTKAICAINALGFPCEHEAIRYLCEMNNLVYIEDNCEGLGGYTSSLSMCGSFGAYGTSSFFFSHHIQTIEGGMLITDSIDLYHAALSLRAHGWIRDLPGNSNYAHKTGDDFSESWKFILPGYNIRPSEINGALGSCQIKKLDGFLVQRRKNAAIYQRILNGQEYVKIFFPERGASWFAFPFILRGPLEDKRQLVIDKLKAHNIESRPIVSGNFLKNPVVKLLNCSYKDDDMAEADIIDKQGFMVGNNHTDLEPQLHYLKEVIEKCL